MEEGDNVAVVHTLWTAFERQGVEGVVALTDPDVAWQPHTAGGVVLHGHEGLRSFFRGLQDRGESLHPRAESFEAHGNCVVVRGSLRVESWSSVKDTSLFWLLRLRDGRVYSAGAYTSHADAIAAFARRD